MQDVKEQIQLLQLKLLNSFCYLLSGAKVTLCQLTEHAIFTAAIVGKKKVALYGDFLF